MKTRSWMVLTVAVLAVGTATGFWVHAGAKPRIAQKDQVELKTLTVKWQRLVGDTGQTCDRCGSTQDEVREAYALLRKSLAPLGIDVVLEEKALDKATAAKDIAESNRIWVADKPIEAWLGATSGTSDCSSCGSIVGAKSACRTVVVGRNAYESIPSALIVKAGLLAAAEIVGAEAAQPGIKNVPLSGVQTITDGTSGTGGCRGQ
ncbi:MAG: DUF2703 domain-containing protein [Armatimonadetes bacterium]|nr:DUF2703 domain-containing protein [Armatimonadota bacterium]